MVGDRYPFQPNYGGTNLVPRGGRRRTRRGGGIGSIPQGGEMGTGGQWIPSGGDKATYSVGVARRGTLGGRRRKSRKSRRRRTARSAFFF